MEFQRLFTRMTGFELWIMPDE